MTDFPAFQKFRPFEQTNRATGLKKSPKNKLIAQCGHTGR